MKDEMLILQGEPMNETLLEILAQKFIVIREQSISPTYRDWVFGENGFPFALLPSLLS